MSVECNKKFELVFCMSFLKKFILSSSSIYCILQKCHSIMDWKFNKKKVARVNLRCPELYHAVFLLLRYLHLKCKYIVYSSISADYFEF